MYQNACGAAAASAGGCVETDRECHGLISSEASVPAAEHDYSGFDIVKATQVQAFVLPSVQFATLLKEIYSSISVLRLTAQSGSITANLS